MTGDVLAGIDVGNATTEVVLVDAGSHPPVPLARDRAPTRGAKGSARANEAAALLTARLARRAGLVLDRAVVTGQRPVTTTATTRSDPPPGTGPLALLTGAGRTPGRAGIGSGVPTDVTGPPRPGPDAVLVVPARTGYDRAAELVRAWLATPGAARVTAVVVHRDEGVLVARRVPGLPAGVPVVDTVDTGRLAGLPLVAVEAAAPGETLRVLADPLRLVALFGLDGADRPAARLLAASLTDAAHAVVALLPGGGPEPALPRPEAPAPPPGGDPLECWSVDLAAVTAAVEGRTAAGRPRTVVTARLGPTGAGPTGAGASGHPRPEEVVAGVLGLPVARIATEAAAARAGALSTPGVLPDAVVLDLGGGTLDAVDATGDPVVAAGAGDLVTASVAAALGLSRAAAEWVKRGPCRRLEGPHVLVGEDGARHFADRPAPADAVGSLVVPGPAGWLPFARDLSPAEWRALRLRIKRAALGDNAGRLVARLPAGGLAGRDVVLAGGVAEDPEILRVLDRALAGATVGRADVAGALTTGLGHRWAVAYGLTVLATAP